MLLFLGLFGGFLAVLSITRLDSSYLFVELIMPREKRRAAGKLECRPDRQLGLLHLTWLLPGVAAIAVPDRTKYSKITTIPGGVQYTSLPAIPFRAHHAAICPPGRFGMSRSSLDATRLL